MDIKCRSWSWMRSLAVLSKSAAPHSKISANSKRRATLREIWPRPCWAFWWLWCFCCSIIPVPSFIHSTLGYVGSLVTPLALLYIGITLADAGGRLFHLQTVGSAVFSDGLKAVKICFPYLNQAV